MIGELSFLVAAVGAARYFDASWGESMLLGGAVTFLLVILVNWTIAKKEY